MKPHRLLRDARSAGSAAAFLFAASVPLLGAQAQQRAVAAIGTWPQREAAATRFRFESFFLDQLVAAGAITRQADLEARFRLNMEALRTAGAVGYFVDRVPDVCLSQFPPPWCRYAGGIIVDSRPLGGGVIIHGRVLIIEALVAGGVLSAGDARAWRDLATGFSLVALAPSVLRHIKTAAWSPEKGLAILDRSFAAVSGAAYPVPDSEWERYCVEHPDDPICWVIRDRPVSPEASALAQEIALIWVLHREKLLSAEQTRSVFDLYYDGLTAGRVGADLPIPAGGIIIHGAKLDATQRAAITTALGANRVGLVDPDSPWADLCLRRNPPRICWFISQFPAASGFTTQLVKAGIWSKAAALEAWNRLHTTLAIETVPLPERSVGR